MAEEIIRPWNLPDRSNPNSSEKIPVDNGSTVAGATIESIVLSGRPTATQAEAVSGTDASKAMVPLTTKQSIASEIGVSIASKTQGDKADSAIQSLVPGSNITVDNTDPQNPIISGSAGGVPASEEEAIDQNEETASNVKMMTPLRTLQAVRAGIKEHGYVTPLMLNADNTDATNAQPMVQASIDEAIDNSCAWYLPAGRYRLDTYVNVSERITMRGAGMRNAVLRGREDGPGVLVVQPPVTGQSNDRNAFFDFQNFGVVNVNFVGAAAMNCILGRNPGQSQGAFMAQFVIERMYFGATEGPGVLLDNNAANYDGFFTFVLRDSWVAGGIKGIKVGDSINIERNQLVLGAPGTIGVDFTGTPGAQQVIISDNNITTTGGAIALLGVEMATVRNNQGEHPAYIRDYDGRFDAHYYIADCLQPSIYGNTISPGPITGFRADGSPHVAAEYSLIIDGSTSDAIIKDNIISQGASGQHITTGPSVFRSTYSGTNRAYAGQALTVLDQGVDTRGVKVELTLVNGFTPGSYGNPIAQKSPNSIITLDGSVSHSSSAGVITTLPVGFRPSSTRIFRVAQNLSTALLQVAPNGDVAVAEAAGFTNISFSGISFIAV